MEALAAIKQGTICPWGKGHCDLRGKQLSLHEKYWLGSRLHFKINNCKELIKKYKLSERTLYKYSSSFRNEGILHNGDGRPVTFDEESCNSIKRLLSSGEYKTTTPDYRCMMLQEGELTAKKRKISTTSHDPPHRTTLWRMETKLAIKTGHGEATTTARMDACADVQNAVTFAAMNACMVPLSKPHLTANLDATQFTVENAKGKIELKYCLVEEEDNVPETLKVVPQKGDGLVSYFIKYYLLMFANGTVASPVFVVADTSMSKRECDVHEVLDMGIGTDVGSKGYIVFCKTRCANNTFYKWLNDSILIPMITAQKTLHGDRDDAITWFQLDGEPVQINVYEDPEVLAALEAHNVVIGKPPASTTSITQPCDIKNCFKGPKTALKNINDLAVKNHFMVKRLLDLATLHEKRCKTKMKAGHKKMFAHGLLRIRMALQQSMRPKMVEESFAAAGIYPYCPMQIMRNCKADITDEQLTTILGAIPRLSSILKRQGELFQKDLAHAGIVNNMDSNKDHLVVYRRRSVLITNTNLIQRECRKRELAEIAAEEKEAKRVERRNKKERKDAAAAATAAVETAAATAAAALAMTTVHVAPAGMPHAGAAVIAATPPYASFDDICNIENVDDDEEIDAQAEEEEPEEEEDEVEGDDPRVLFQN
jgi:hypothetical protein